MLCWFLKFGDVVIDIGVYIGDIMFLVGLVVGIEGVVFVLELNKYVYKVLLVNVVFNWDFINIYLFNFVVMEVDGKFEFEYLDLGYCNGGWYEGISILKYVYFFKLEVEGCNVCGYFD